MKNCVDAIVDDNGQTFDHFSFRQWLQDGDGAISAAVETLERKLYGTAKEVAVSWRRSPSPCSSWSPHPSGSVHRLHCHCLQSQSTLRR